MAKNKQLDLFPVEEMKEMEVESVTLSQEKFEHCEWCYQFDDEEPQIFAWTDDTIDSTEEPRVSFTIGNQKEAYITFSAPNGRTFKLFPRELTDAGKELREKSKLKTQ